MAESGMFERGRTEARAFFGLATGFCVLGAVSWAWPLVVGMLAAVSVAAALGMWWWRRRRSPESGFPFGLAAPGASWGSVMDVPDRMDQDPVAAGSVDPSTAAGNGEHGDGEHGDGQQGGRWRETAWAPMGAGRDAA